MALDLDPKTAGISVVIHGHTHKPTVQWKNGVLYFNPGSAGPKRFELPISVGRLKIKDGKVEPELVELVK